MCQAQKLPKRKSTAGVERFARPAIVFGEGGRGSGRSIERFHLHEALLTLSRAHDRSGIESFGGHAHAAGVRLRAGCLERFRGALIDHASTVLTADDLHRVHVHDGALGVEEIALSLCRALERAAPFGRKNPEPLFLFEDVAPTNVRVLNGGHVKATVNVGERPIDLIAFGAGSRAALFGQRIDVLATPEVNEWRGNLGLQLRVRDVRPKA